MAEDYSVPVMLNIMMFEAISTEGLGKNVWSQHEQVYLTHVGELRFRRAGSLDGTKVMP